MTYKNIQIVGMSPISILADVTEIYVDGELVYSSDDVVEPIPPIDPQPPIDPEQPGEPGTPIEPGTPVEPGEPPIEPPSADNVPPTYKLEEELV